MKNLIKVLSVCYLMAFAAPAFAQISFDIHFGPPPPRHEVIVAAPYPGAIWVAGYYRFDYGLNQYVWMPGVWQRPPQPGMVWIAPRYPSRGGRYGFAAGHWQAPGRRVVRHRGGRRGVVEHGGGPPHGVGPGGR